MRSKSPSIVLVTASLLSILLVTFLTTMISTILVLESSEGDAEKINAAGSLRMYSMRIALAYQTAITDGSESTQGQADLIKDLAEFDARLQTALQAEETIYSSDTDPVIKQLHTIENNWKSIRSRIMQGTLATTEVTHELKTFVGTIDDFVTLIQQRTESTLNSLHLLHSIGIVLTVLIAFVLMRLLRRRILQPLHELVVGARRAQSGDFSFRVQYQTRDELGEVALAYNNMAESLGILYADLETRVQEKTEELQRRNDALQFLNQAARTLALSANSKSGYQSLMHSCQQITGFSHLKLVVFGVNSEKPVFICEVHVSPASIDEQDSPIKAEDVSRIDLHHDKKLLGYLEVTIGDTAMLPWQQQLLDTFADIISKAFGNLISIEREHRLLLVEERATIARELHDSIAQTLSFLKIQMSRFGQLLNKDADKEALEAVAGKLKEGISIAYQQLREVLTTFRLQAHEPGLEQALRSAISEYSQRGSLDITLQYNLNDLSPTANEEMHILQIIREALTNIVKHANASKAWVELSELKDNQVIIQVKDNGIGMSNSESPFSHGITIMNERANKLGGECTVYSTKDEATQEATGSQGTTVNVVCWIGLGRNDLDYINPFIQ